MNVEQVLRWIIVAIVLLVAAWLLMTILRVAVALLNLVLPVLLVLLIVAVVLRFFTALGQRRRY